VITSFLIQSEVRVINEKETKPLAPISPNPLHQTENGGWSGRAKCFMVDENIISIKAAASDGNYEEPSDDKQRGYNSPEGKINCYKQFSHDDEYYKYYLQELGKLCAFHVFEKGNCIFIK
jgi:hypothetical protein